MLSRNLLSRNLLHDTLHVLKKCRVKNPVPLNGIHASIGHCQGQINAISLWFMSREVFMDNIIV
ncbi:MAG: hypothetical protein ACTSU9_02550 [Promethearchaeota archaeon]